MGYFIRTKSGVKGPFEVEALRSLLAKGKIPPGRQVIDASSRRLIPVSEAITAETSGNGGAPPPPRTVALPQRRPLAGRPRVSRRTAPARAARPPRRFPAWLKGVGGSVLLLVISIAVMGFLFWKKGEDLRGYAVEQIHSLNLPAEDTAVLLLMAEFDHGAALDQATPRDLRGRRKHLSASKETYIRILLSLIQERLEKMTRDPPQRESQLHGYWRRNSDDCFHVVNLKSDNTYEQNVYLRTSAGRSNPLETLKGTWKLEDGKIIWYYDGRTDPNPFVRWSSRDFVIREMNGSFTYWRSTAPDTR